MCDHFFIGLGFAKSGTTQLVHLLNQHPRIASAVIKETNYLYVTPTKELSLDKYLSFFGPKDPTPRINLECSVGYIEKIDEIIEKLSHLNLNYTFFCCLRNPIDRSYSHFQFLKQQGKIDASVNIWDLEDSHPVFDQSRYEKYLTKLNRVTNVAPVIINFDDIKNNPLQLTSQIFHTLNLHHHPITLNNLPSSKTFKVRSQTLARIKSKIYRTLRHTRYVYLIHSKPGRFLSFLFKKLLYTEINDPQKADVENYLKAKLASETNYFKRLSFIYVND